MPRRTQRPSTVEGPTGKKTMSIVSEMIPPITVAREAGEMEALFRILSPATRIRTPSIQGRQAGEAIHRVRAQVITIGFG